MSLVIDSAFVEKWHPQYDDTEHDENKYQGLLTDVKSEIGTTGTISKNTFVEIWRWKKAIRAIRHVRLSQYETVYSPAFRQAVLAPPSKRLATLIGPATKLPGIGAPSGSTLIHFIHPHDMPIIDVRTVGVLFAAGLLSTKRCDLEAYDVFRTVVLAIHQKLKIWTLREIDRALFAYHKQVLTNGNV